MIVFGASGKTGREVVKEAQARGFKVTAFVRDAAKAPAGTAVIVGDVSDAQAVADAIKGHDLVISTLGVGTPLKPDPLVVQGVRNIVAAKPHRLVYMSAAGAPWPLRYMIRHELADHRVKEAIIEGSEVSYTIVRPTFLTTRFRKVVARFLLEQGSSAANLRQAVVISRASSRS